MKSHSPVPHSGSHHVSLSYDDDCGGTQLCFKIDSPAAQLAFKCSLLFDTNSCEIVV